MIAPDPAAAILRASTYRRSLWKNGAGETTEIAISPVGSSLDNFDWRISMATVGSDGPFSVFAGVDRTLCILDGAGIQLQVADKPVRQLDHDSPPLSFSGDEATHARLVDGAVTDFNVMTRRGRFTHSVQRIRLQARAHHDVPPEVHAVFCQAGVVTIELATGRERLEPRDTMLRRVSDSRAWTLHADASATVCVVTIAEK